VRLVICDKNAARLTTGRHFVFGAGQLPGVKKAAYSSQQLFEKFFIWPR
jgi:hypothetical protein